MGVQDRDWYWQDSGGNRRGGPLHRPPSRRLPALQRQAILVVISLVSVVVAGFGINEAYRVYALRTVAQMARTQQAMLQKQQVEEQARQEALGIELARKEGERLRAIRERQEMAETRRQDDLAESDRKARAWAKFYKAPSYCSDAATIECANGFIRAKRAFEQRWAQGGL
jgi:hypothetical protein